MKKEERNKKVLQGKPAGYIENFSFFFFEKSIAHQLPNAEVCGKASPYKFLQINTRVDLLPITNIQNEQGGKKRCWELLVGCFESTSFHLFGESLFDGHTQFR